MRQVRLVVDDGDVAGLQEGEGLDGQVAHEVGVGHQQPRVADLHPFDEPCQLLARREAAGDGLEGSRQARVVGPDGVVPEESGGSAGQAGDVLENCAPEADGRVEFLPAAHVLGGQGEPQGLAELARHGPAHADDAHAFRGRAVLLGADEGHGELPARGQVPGQAVAELFGPAVAAQGREHEADALHRTAS